MFPPSPAPRVARSPRALPGATALLGAALVVLPSLAFVGPARAFVLDARVARSSDDAVESPTAQIALGGPELQLGLQTHSEIVGLRWVGLTIPPGATIVAASIRFTASRTETQGTSLTIFGEAADDPATFAGSKGNLSSRPRTTATASWSPPGWTTGQAVAAELTPDLSAVLQEIVNRPGWAKGNSIVILVTGSGLRTAWSYDGSHTRAAVLHVEYTVPEVAPTAQLSVVQIGSPALTVRADGTASADPDTTPIARYDFDFGDSTPVVTTAPPNAIAQHTYAAAGTYTVMLVATDTGGRASSPASRTIAVSVQPPSPVAVYAGYYDTHHSSNPQPKPDPWKGSPQVTFVGTSDTSTGGWDTSTIRIDNLTGADLTGVVVTCDIGTHHFALWGTRSIPAGYALILAQTAVENFDGSDTNPAGCVNCNPNECLTMVSSTIPVVHVTIAGTTTDFYDSGQVLNTHGVDAAGCPYTGTRNDESEPWQQIFPRSAGALAKAAQALPQRMTPPLASLSFAQPSPNPSHGAVLMHFSLATDGAVRLGVFDVTGRLVRSCIDGVLEAGEYRNEFVLNGANPGVYYAVLTTAEGTLRRTFVLVR